MCTKFVVIVLYVGLPLLFTVISSLQSTKVKSYQAALLGYTNALNAVWGILWAKFQGGFATSMSPFSSRANFLAKTKPHPQVSENSLQ